MRQENTQWSLIYGAQDPTTLLDAVPPKGITPAQRTIWYGKIVAYLEVAAPAALGLPATATPEETRNVHN
jgi:hypothetical protein